MMASIEREGMTWVLCTWMSVLLLRFCVEVTEPVASATTTWPDNTGDRCFVIRTNSRNYFLVAETVEEKG